MEGSGMSTSATHEGDECKMEKINGDPILKVRNAWTNHGQTKIEEEENIIEGKKNNEKRVSFFLDNPN